MDRALIVSLSEDFAATLAEALASLQVQSAAAQSCAAARALLAAEQFALCVVNAPLPDGSAERLAMELSAATQVILLVKAERLEAACARTAAHGVLTLGKPVSRVLLRGAILLARAAQCRQAQAQQENQRLRQTIEDIQVIDRAERLLISRLAMSETEAHRYVEKQAMDMRITRRVAAEEILRTEAG